MSDGRRPKRRCVAVKEHVPSAIHYVGYVEDDETPEMIMKKFEELERIKQAAAETRRQRQPSTGSRPEAAAAGPSAQDVTVPGQPSTAARIDMPEAAGDAAAKQQAGQVTADARAFQDAAGTSAGPNQHDQASRQHAADGQEAEHHMLDEEALLEVFKQTSIFNVRSALANNELLMAGDHNPMRDGEGGLRDANGNVAYGMEDLLYIGGGNGTAEGVYGSDLEDDELQYLKGFWSDEDFEVGGGARADRDKERRESGKAAGPRKKGERSRAGSAARADGKEPRQKLPGASGQSRHVMHQVVTQYNRDTNALIRRRIRVGSSGGAAGSGPGAAGGLVQVRVPPAPLPLSWGRTVRPYEEEEQHPPCSVPTTCPSPPQPPAPPSTDTSAAAAAAAATGGTPCPAAPSPSPAPPEPVEGHNFEASPSLSSFPYDQLMRSRGGREYVCVLVNAQWQPEGAADAFEAGQDVMARLQALPIPRLCPRGFVMVWVHKGLIQPCCRLLASWGYVYVENLTWVHLTPGNAIARGPGAHFCRSHSTLLMFRKEGEGRDIELRHQRNPDVVFDCLRSTPDGSCGVPPEVLTTIETLLPTGKGAFLELWAQRGVRRPGWDHVSEVA